MIRFRLQSICQSLLIGSLCLLLNSAWSVGLAAEVTEQRIQEAVIAHVQEKLHTLIPQEKPEHIVVKVLKVPAAPFSFPQAKTAEAIQLEINSLLDRMYSERAIIRVRMAVAGSISREVGVPVQVVIKKPVWVVKNTINANEPLRRSDFSLESRNVSHSYSHAVGQERNLDTYIARVNLRPGELLDSRKIVIPPDVTYNDSVNILITSDNGMTITMPGIALSNGRIGETIRVRQAVYQRKYYSAKVIDKNRVQVEM